LKLNRRNKMDNKKNPAGTGPTQAKENRDKGNELKLDHEIFFRLNLLILDEPVFADSRLFKIFMWCLLKATYKDRTINLKVGKGYQQINLQRGQFIFGRNKATEELQIPGTTLYRSIVKLEKMGYIKIQADNQYSIITVCYFDHYRPQFNKNGQGTDNQRTTNGTDTEQIRTQTNNVEEVNKVSKVNRGIPSFEEFKNYALQNKQNIDLERLEFKYKGWKENGWKDGNGKDIKNWKMKLLNTLPYLEKKPENTTNKGIPSFEETRKHLERIHGKELQQGN